MSLRPRRTFAALAAAALSCISVFGLQATAASAAEGDQITASQKCYVNDLQVDCATGSPVVDPTRPGRSYDASTRRYPSTKTDNEYQPASARQALLEADPTRPVVEVPPVITPPVIETFAQSSRPVDRDPALKPIWCTDLATGDVFQCGWQS